jgi:ligand-binding SRPBCC domain-containing protein
MSVRCLKTVQLLPVSLAVAWDFFATPLNLSKIKPAAMKFKILSELPPRIYPGLFINYKVAPVFHVPLNWTTEITKVVPEQYFIDEQRVGPFKLWHHEHHFKATEGGVLMTDIVYYEIGKSVLGVLAGILFVHAKVKWIFAYRYRKLEHMFNADPLPH